MPGLDPNPSTTTTRRTDEEIRDLVASFLVAGTNITISHDDDNDTLTIASTASSGTTTTVTLTATQFVTLVQGLNATQKEAVLAALGERKVFLKETALGEWNRESGANPVAGGYYAATDRLIIHNENQASENKRTELIATAIESGFQVGSKNFIVEGVNSSESSNYVRFDGRWTSDGADDTALNANASISLILYARVAHIGEEVNVLSLQNSDHESRIDELEDAPDIPNFALNTAYSIGDVFKLGGMLYEVVGEILSTNTSNVATLLAANTIRTLGDGGGDADLDDADVRGREVANVSLPTTATDGVYTRDWTEVSPSITGVDNAGGLLRVPKQQITDATFGFVVVAFEGATEHSTLFLQWGAVEPDPTGNDRAYDDKVLSWDNGEKVLVRYYHDNTDGHTIALEGVGDTLPASASVKVYLAVAGNVQASGSGQQQQQQQGVTYVGPNIIWLQQWRRSASKPTTPTTVGYTDGTPGTFSNYPETGWHPQIPSGEGPLWIATAKLLRNDNDTWTVTAWTVTSTDSSLIEFYNYDTEAWESNPSSTMSEIRIWSDGDWLTIPVNTNHLLWQTNVDGEPGTTVSDIPLRDLERLRFDITQDNLRASAWISVQMLAGENLNMLNAYSAGAAATKYSQTAVVIFDDYGYAGVMVIGNVDVRQLNHTIGGGFYINFFANSDNELTNIKIISTFGRANFYRQTRDTIVRIYAET